MARKDESKGGAEHEGPFQLCQCGYILKLTPMSGVCPECGEVLLEDKGFSFTWRSTQFGIAKASVILGVIGLLVLICTMMMLYAGVNIRKEAAAALILPYPFIAIGGFICAIARIGRPRDRSIAKWGLIISLILLLNPCALIFYAGFIFMVTGTSI